MALNQIKIFLLIVIILVTKNVIAKNEFQYQIDLKKSSFSNNESQQSDNKATFTYYMKPMMDGNYPFAEASFINRVPSVTLSSEYSFLDYALDNITLKDAAIYAKYIDKNRPISLSVFYRNMKGDGDVADELIVLKNQTIHTEIGWYFTRNTQIAAGYSRISSKENRDDNLAFKNKAQVYGAYFNHLFSFSNKRYFKIESKLTKKKSVDDIISLGIRQTYSTYKAALGATYYFSKSFGIRIRGSRNRIINPSRDGGKEISIKLSKFYTPQTSMDFEISEYKADNDNRDNDYDILAFSLSHRF